MDGNEPTRSQRPIHPSGMISLHYVHQTRLRPIGNRCPSFCGGVAEGSIDLMDVRGHFQGLETSEDCSKCSGLSKVLVSMFRALQSRWAEGGTCLG
jgi:hypothetical protein